MLSEIMEEPHSQNADFPRIFGQVFNARRLTMKWVLYILGVLFFLMGSGWILQGIGVIPVGGMAYQVKWAYAGIVVDLVGIGLIVLASRRRKNLPPSP
jgi:hypothetical protein